jgi:uncharacterized protein
MIIDIHTHAWPPTISSKAQSTLEGLFKVKFVGDPTPETLERYMEKNHVAISVISSVATKPQQVTVINNWLFGIRSSRCKVFCAMHPEFHDWKEELRRIRERGDGIKLQPEFQDFYVDEERMFPMYEEIDRLQLPLLFHTGEELSGTFAVRSAPHRLIKIKERLPGIVIIAAHFGGFRLTDEVEEYLLGKDIYMDTSFFFDYLPRERVIKLLLAHRPDRIIFGSDFPLIDPKKDIDFLQSLDIPLALKEKILFSNAQKLLKL